MFIKKLRLSNLPPKDVLDKLLMFQVLKESLGHIENTNSNLYPEITGSDIHYDANDNVGGTN